MVKPLINAICRWDYGILLLDDKEEQHIQNKGFDGFQCVMITADNFFFSFLSVDSFVQSYCT